MAVSGLQSGAQILQRSYAMAEDASQTLNNAAARAQERRAEDKEATSQAESARDNAQTNDTANKDPNSVKAKDEAIQAQKIKQKQEDADLDTTGALIKLNQSTQYGRIGANVIQRNQAMIGSLLDVHI